MSLKEFRRRDIFFNLLETHPEQEFFINQLNIYYRKGSGLNQTPEGHIDLYELNVNRSGTGDLIYPFITRDSTRGSFTTISANAAAFAFGDKIAGTYPMSASLSRVFIPVGPAISHYTFDDLNGVGTYVAKNANKKYINALQNVIRSYTKLSPHFSFERNVGTEIWDKNQQAINLISVPSIFYGTSIKKKSVKLGFYMSGSLISEASDIYGNGELVETTGSNSGEVAGVVLYDHGFLVLTGSWDMESVTGQYDGDATAVTPKWLNFGMGMPAYGVSTPRDGTAPSASYAISFKGVQRIPTLTMFAHAGKGEFNYSSNPTAILREGRSTGVLNNAYMLIEQSSVKSIAKSNFKDHEKAYSPETYISKIGIYDEKENLLGIATLATPVKKNEKREYTFKLKLDI